MTSAPPGTAAPSVWTEVAAAVDPRLRRPRLRDGVVAGAPERGRHGEHVVLRSPVPGNYLRLAAAERELVELMDGDHTVRELAVEHFLQHRSFALARIHRLVANLHAHAFLTEDPVDTYAEVHRRLLARTRRGRVDRVLGALTGAELVIARFDPLVTAVHRRVGRHLLRGPGLALLAVVAAAGAAALVTGPGAPPLRLAWLVSAGPGPIAAVVGFFGLLVAWHELAHAVVAKHAGRDVPRGGFTFYFGFPVFFVDTTDVWLEPRRRRILVSAAGVGADLVLGGAAALAAWIVPGTAGELLGVLAVMAYLGVLVNLIPLLALDGYYVLVDVARIPMLRPRALRFVRAALPGRLRRREALTGEEWILACYGVLAAVFAVAVVWWSAARLAGQVIEVGQVSVAGGVALGVALALLIGLPALIRLARQARRGVALLDARARAAAAAAAAARLRGRVALLSGIGVLAELPEPQLRHVAAVMRPRRFRAGADVVVEGAAGDEFHLVVRGSARVVKRGHPQPLARLGPGDYFGELALLHRAPRAATVTATTDLETWALPAAEFTALLGPSWSARERAGRAADLRRALAQVPLFAQLRPTDVDLLAARMRTDGHLDGTAIVTEGEPGDRFFVLLDGTVEVSTRADGFVRTQGPGEYFGEIALLLDVARTATVRARGPVRTASLARADFDELLLRFLRLDAEVERVGRGRLRHTGHGGVADDTAEGR